MVLNSINTRFLLHRYKAWFEFVEDKKSGNNRPFFTYMTMAICSAFLLASIALNDWSIEPFSVNPMIGPDAETLVAMGAKQSLLIVRENEIWRLASAMVLHAGLIHYLLNMLALWFVGSAVELCHGFLPSLLLFVFPAIGGTILSAIFLPRYISVGASGGIFGLIGACLADIFMNWGLLFNDFVTGDRVHRHTMVLIVLLLDIFINSLVGLTPFVDNFTRKFCDSFPFLMCFPFFVNFHVYYELIDLGGMLFGFLCGTSAMQRVSTEIFDGAKQDNFWTTMKRNLSRYIGIIISVLGLCVSLIVLLGGDGVTTPCKSCNALSCMPFPPWVPYEDKWWYCDDCGSVTADARIDPFTEKFDQLSMNCPNGVDVVVDLDTSEENDKDWLENNLPNFCREYCLL